MCHRFVGTMQITITRVLIIDTLPALMNGALRMGIACHRELRKKIEDAYREGTAYSAFVTRGDRLLNHTRTDRAASDAS
jgi:hypothetical protein